MTKSRNYSEQMNCDEFACSKGDRILTIPDRTNAVFASNVGQKLLVTGRFSIQPFWICRMSTPPTLTLQGFPS